MKHIYLLLITLFIGSFGFAQTTIYNEGFTGQNGKGAVGPTPSIDLTGVDWTIDISSTGLTATTDWFRVQNELFEARDIDGDGIWFSPVINISNFTNVNFSLDAGERGTMEASDIFITEYRIDGGSWVEADTNGNLNDDFSSEVVSQLALTGSSLEIRVTMNNGAGSEYHELDNILVEGDPISTCNSPTSEATAFSASSITTDAATLAWTRGTDGDNVIVIMKEGSAVDFSPSSGTPYIANANFSSGTELGTGNYVIFNGAGTSQAITGLTSNTTYYIAIYEYNNTDTCYMSTALTDSFATLANTSVEFTSTTASVSEAVGTYDLEFTIANEGALATTFDVVLASGDASDIDSYTTQSETFPGSSTTDITVTITVTDDAIIETDEVFTFEIQNVAGGNSAVVGTNNTFDLTITNNDFPTTIEFISSSASVAESAGTYDLVIEIANEDVAATTFDVVLTSGDASDIDSYTTQSETFPGSSTTDITVTITVTDDAIIETDEVFTFEIQNVAGGNSAAVGTNNAFDLTITNNDFPTTVEFTSSSDSVSEGVGTYDLEFTIANENATATSFEVVLTGGDGDAADINGYTTQTVTFPGGSTVNQVVTLTVTDDALLEANETLTFEIQNVTGGSSAVAGTNNSFTLTITNNDVAPPTVITLQ